MTELILSFVLGVLGFVSIVSRRTLLGVLVGIHLVLLGASSLFILSGFGMGVPEKGSAFALFILFVGVSQLVIGYAIANRVFERKKNINIENLTTLKH